MEWSASAPPPQFLMTGVELCLCPSYSSERWVAKKHPISIQRVIQTRDLLHSMEMNLLLENLLVCNTREIISKSCQFISHSSLKRGSWNKQDGWNRALNDIRTLTRNQQPKSKKASFKNILQWDRGYALFPWEPGIKYPGGVCGVPDYFSNIMPKTQFLLCYSSMSWSSEYQKHAYTEQ